MTYYIFRIIIVLPALIYMDCYRDQPSSYNFDKIQSINLISPQGGEHFKMNDSVNVQWTSVNLTGLLRIDLIDSTTEVYSIGKINNTGTYTLQIPGSVAPSKNYKLKIESMSYPQVNDITKNYFEISPDIDGHWFYSNVENDQGMEVNLNLSSYIGDSFSGEGTFYFKYFYIGTLRGYDDSVTVIGILSFPRIGIQLNGSSNREFNFTGEMVTNNEIRGKMIGFIDSTYGSINDSLILRRQ